MPDSLLDREYISVSDASESIGVTGQTIQRWIRAGHVQALKFPGSAGYRIDVESLERFLRERTVLAAAKRELDS